MVTPSECISIVKGTIVLAGGTARRLGGVSKPDYPIAGTRLLDILFDELKRAGYNGIISVVGPPELSVPPNAILTLEDPPFGGPLAGIAAGVHSLSSLSDDDAVFLTTCDAPLSPRLLPDLTAVLHQSSDQSFVCDGVVPASNESSASTYHGALRTNAVIVPASKDDSVTPNRYGVNALQYTHGLYKMGALRRLPFQRNGSIRWGFASLHLETILDTRNDCFDVDTPESAAQLAQRLSS
ncbi:molybdenum cofactor guanylyltransferase [Arcanobacterium bovis]|uniref:Molybdopterin-guanine dinucleotide biosynthesis protein MobA n=1 Tax=Arcanobacterium bovis TaxID=2529275 RepID=A0A4Q9V0H1_9ACTO|nr:nucleotidyltransferase family protein [Arcanobacterium bovis]TBW22124.1 molybdopterin-guanine dinucleotide biosynthesis protein MobA [Arcanobacterium bovis]